MRNHYCDHFSQGGYLFGWVCLLVCLQDYIKNTVRISAKTFASVKNGLRKYSFHFGGFSNDVAHSFFLTNWNSFHMESFGIFFLDNHVSEGNNNSRFLILVTVIPTEDLQELRC